MLTNASMITADADRDAVVLLGTRVPLDQPAQQVAAAVFAGTADGVYEARINDQPVTDSVLNPGWTAYEWRLQVQHFDVSSLLTGGGTDHVALEVRLGNGWYRGDLGFAGPNANYGKQIGFVAELVISYRDGATQTIVTDTTWTARASDTPSSSLYLGQAILRRGDSDRTVGPRTGDCSRQYLRGLPVLHPQPAGLVRGR